MEIRPILSTLLRHKTAAALIVVEIALSCAIICNALFLIGSRIERIDRVSGIAVDEMVRVRITGIGTDTNADALTKTDLAALRALPGVTDAVSVNQVPFYNSSWNTGIDLAKDQKVATLGATMYMADDHFIKTFGLTLVEGRNFSTDELVDWNTLQKPGVSTEFPAMIVTRSLASKLFPNGDALGKGVYTNGGQTPTRIVGIVDHLIRPSNQGGDAEREFSMVLPTTIPYTDAGNYIMRTDPARRDEVLKAARATLMANGPNRIILDGSKSMAEVRDEYYREDRAMIWLLVAVCVALLIVTALGIVGLASFWVQQRTRQIGIRRALGATRGQILRYFQTENFLLATVGIVFGMLLAYGINQLLMSKYELPRLPLIYLPVGAIALWLLGQIAVFGPARKAAAVPPAVATRSA